MGDLGPVEVGGIAALAGLVVNGAFRFAEKALDRKRNAGGNGNGKCHADELAPAIATLTEAIRGLRDDLGGRLGDLGATIKDLSGTVDDFRRETTARLAVIEDRIPKRRAGK